MLPSFSKFCLETASPFTHIDKDIEAFIRILQACKFTYCTTDVEEYHNYPHTTYSETEITFKPYSYPPGGNFNSTTYYHMFPTQPVWEESTGSNPTLTIGFENQFNHGEPIPQGRRPVSWRHPFLQSYKTDRFRNCVALKANRIFSNRFIYLGTSVVELTLRPGPPVDISSLPPPVFTQPSKHDVDAYKDPFEQEGK